MNPCNYNGFILNELNSSMKNLKVIASLFVLSLFLGAYANNEESTEKEIIPAEEVASEIVEPINNDQMKLGAFSISLSVKDLKTSKEFYEKFGFTILGGSMEKNYLIMKNENSLIGLFQGMFEGNILTFNPGWDENGKDIEKFNDIRQIQEHLKKEGIINENQIDSSTSGPASLMITDPDGNMILLDQHR